MWSAVLRPLAAPSRSATPAAAEAPAHSALEDVLGVISGAFVASLGLFLLKTSGAVTGGTAGLALLVSYAVPVPFGVLFFVINAPFFLLAVTKKGWSFTIRTAIAVALVALLSGLHPRALPGLHPDPVYAAVAGNLLAGIGLLILFRHRASLGGFNVVALIVQERVGWRAGYVQMAMDVCVVLAALSVVAPRAVLVSAIGAVVLNVVLAFNHRPGRYLGM